MAQKKLESEGHNFKLNGVYSYPPFKNNEQHIRYNYGDIDVNYLDETIEGLIDTSSNLDPWFKLVEENKIKPSNILTGVPPCSGLSLLNSNTKKGDHARGPDAAQNNWLLSAIKFYLATDSDVLVVENAPGLSTAKGLPLVSKIKRIIDDNNMNRKIQLIKTTTMNHGIPQERDRTFLIIHKQPKFIRFKNKPHDDILLEDYLRNFKALDNDPCNINLNVCKKTDEWIRFFDQYPEFIENWKKIPDQKKSTSSWKVVLKTVSENPKMLEGYPNLKKEHDHILRKHLMDMGYWDGSPTFAKGKVNAVISKNRLCTLDMLNDYKGFLTLRQFMHLMGIPKTFNLVEPLNLWKHISQNVPVNTAADSILWAMECLDVDNCMDTEYFDYTIHDNHHKNIKNEYVGYIDNKQCSSKICLEEESIDDIFKNIEAN